MKIRIDPLDTLFSRYIRLRDGACQRCGNPNTQTAHCHGRGRKSTRWDESNCCALCMGCHVYLDSQPIEKIEFFKQRLGELDFDLLAARARTPARYLDKKLLTIYFKAKIEQLINKGG
ncbi:hypothetical protein LCGC14_1382140 [marine sediment metagenome]|uniref:HNH nuclease domain-containing protein n=1 Tax=marine sediment metagenome TaxID=412755 RepID=A0A0F9KN63_9ZZZZ